MTLGLADTAAEHLKFEYGDLQCMVEVVDSMARQLIFNAHGSGHTESIVCADSEAGDLFLQRVNTACVF